MRLGFIPGCILIKPGSPTKSLIILLTGFILIGCQDDKTGDSVGAVGIENRLAKYSTVKLTADLGVLTEKERQMIPLLIEAAKVMDELFWMQAYGDKEALLGTIADPKVRRLVEMNYGPWDRLEGDEPFLQGVGPKPKGANFYPKDMGKEEFEDFVSSHSDRVDAFNSLYTSVRRDEEGRLVAVPYHEVFANQLRVAQQNLEEAATLAEDPGLRRYLELRAHALLSDNYQPSDLAWMDMKDNTIDVVIGPIETYEDQLFGYKAAYEAYILVKDKEWSRRLARYADLLPGLQRGLPVPEKYKREDPGTESDLNVYDAIYYAGNCNAGPKTIAINLPNDEEVQLKKGSRRLQLKNSLRAKFEKILFPIADLLIAEDQRQYITFDAFFGNTMFHEVAHGLGIKNTVNGKGTVREALKELGSPVEEGKADALGLYMVTKLHEQGEQSHVSLMDNYATSLASIFRSIRFGASEAHGRANLVRFNFLKQMGAFSRNDETGAYRVHFDRLQEAIKVLSEKLLRFQGDGDYDGVKAFEEEMGEIDPVLESDLTRLAKAGIPVDIVFDQGMEVLSEEQ